MFAVVLIALVVSLLVLALLVVFTFLRVAFMDPNILREQKENEEIRLSLEKIAGLKVDPEKSTSPTYGQLADRGAFREWVQQHED
ncbi:MAG: hypothetical protein CMJ81_12710 [Planctomycetaceae bacterium]|jgi:hypothetical protein|nr:hypothetical protein [Planctomycetaceae bacterium]